MATTTYVAAPVTASLNAETVSTDRIVISGSGTTQWDMKYQGTSICVGGAAYWGYNLGVFEYYPDTIPEIDAFLAQLYSENVRIIRLVGFNRTFGAPTKASGDSNRVYTPGGTEIGTNADGFYNKKHPRHWEKLKLYARRAAKIGIWSVICMEGDIKQSGTQDTAWNGSVFDPTTGTYDRALTLATASGESIPGGLADWGLAGGYNVFTSKKMFAQCREEAKRLAREFRSYDKIFAYEFLSEPLPPSGTITTALNGRTLGAGSKYYIFPGINNDGVYGAEWSFRAGNPNAPAYLPGGDPNDGPPNGCLSIEEFYRTLIADVSAIDPNTPFIVGGRGGYNLSPEGDEVIAALSDSTGLGGNLIAANKIILTWDRLGSGTNQAAKSTGVWLQALGLKVPIFMNQLGERVGSDGQKDPGDPNTFGLRASVRAAKAAGCPGTIWDRRGNGANGYGTEAKNVAPDAYGNGGSFTMNTTRQNDLAQVFGESAASLEAAAIAAATAENACLVYVKSDLSNVVKTGASVPYTLTQITPVVDPLGVGMIFTSAGPVPVTLDYAQKDGSGNSYLPDDRLVMRFTGGGSSGSWLAGNFVYFGTTGGTSSSAFTGDEAMTVIVAGMPQKDGTQATFLTVSNSGGTEKYPQIQATTGKVAQVKWQGGTGGAVTLVGVNTLTDAFNPGVPMVISVRKSGTHPATTVTQWINGIDDTGTGNAGVGTGETYAGTAGTLTGQTVPVSGTNISRLRVGGPNNNGDFVGPIAGFCLARQAMSDANVRAIGRWFSYLMGGGYKA